jgi:hypothetical protein
MAVFGTKEYSKVFDEYKKGQKWLNDVTVEIVGGEADIDPLTLLRIYDETPTVDNELVLATGFCTNRVVRFFKNDKQIYEVNFQGGDISDSFKGYPFLLDLLLKLSYGLMLKKLTPPSEDLVSEERQ